VSPIQRFVKMVGHFEDKYYVKGLRMPPTFMDNWIEGNDYTVLQFCSCKFSHKQTLRQILFDIRSILFTKTANSLFEPPFGDLR